MQWLYNAQGFRNWECIVNKWCFFVCFLVFFTIKGFAQSDFTRGEELFVQNNPREALPYLERTVASDPAHVKAYLYLGIAYQQLNRIDEAIAAYRKILPGGGNETARIAYNLGNAYYTKGNAVFAEQFYTQAITESPSYSSAYLNRANTRVKTGSLKTAIPDYEYYLTLEPASSKRPIIEKMIAFTQEEFAAEERRKFMAAEEARIEAERKQRLLEEVSASLQAAAEDSKGLSAGAEDIHDYEGEFELE
jgi:tetratricopeptide (TPR) repeat protein